jgi:hypothetical protein
MRRNLIGILASVFFSFLFAAPVGAFDLSQCAPFPDETTEFTLIAEDNIIFEPQALQSPPRVIQGNVLVTSLHPAGGTFNNTGIGFVRVGANTNIDGTVIADVLFLPDGGATIKHCIANTIVANTAAAQASCGSGFPVVGTPFTDYMTAHPTCVGPLTSGLCGPNPVVDNCVNGKPALTVGIPFANPLAPGCYGALTIQSGAVLELVPGVYTFASVNMAVGARLIGPATQGAPTATVNVNTTFITGNGVTISDIKLNVARDTTAEIVQIFNNSMVNNVIVNAPFGKCHLHTGDILDRCSEVCCEVLDVEPIIAKCVPPTPPVCVCPPGTHFEFGTMGTDSCDDAPTGLTCSQYRSCVPDVP